MIAPFFEFLDLIDNFLWSWIAFPLLMVFGIYFTFRSGFVQLRRFPVAMRNFFAFLSNDVPRVNGLHPLRAFFSSVGGAMGIGNVVAVCTAVQIGGPGALFWFWLTALLGMVVKYSELFLGVRYRVMRADGQYDGGPMYFLRHAYRWSWIPPLVAFLLCIYGVEIYQFSVVTKSLSHNLGVEAYFIAIPLLLLVLYAGVGGIPRVSAISSCLVPLFFVCYFGMGLWVLWLHLDFLPSLFATIFTSAFTGHAAIGGFAGSSLMLAASMGIRRACYSGDLGIGYSSIIHAESRVRQPEKQAALAFVEIFFDSFLICTMSIMIILATGVWTQDVKHELMIQEALSRYFPYMNVFMPCFLLLLGYSTLINYFAVGRKCALHLAPGSGHRWYYLYSVIVLPLFAFVDASAALSVMSITAAALLVINLVGIYLLRRSIGFEIEPIDLAQDVAHEPVFQA